MESPATIVVAALTAIVLLSAVITIFRHRGGGCCSHGGRERRVRVADRNPANYPYSVRLTVEGMSCIHCRRKVENELNAKGTLWAEANRKEGTALVRMKELLPDEALRRIVSRAGCTVVGIEPLS